MLFLTAQQPGTFWQVTRRGGVCGEFVTGDPTLHRWPRSSTEFLKRENKRFLTKSRFSKRVTRWSLNLRPHNHQSNALTQRRAIMMYNFLSMPNWFKPREFKEFLGGYSHTRFNHNDVWPSLSLGRGLVDFYDWGGHVHIWGLKFWKDKHVWGLKFWKDKHVWGLRFWRLKTNILGLRLLWLSPLSKLPKTENLCYLSDNDISVYYS